MSNLPPVIKCLLFFLVFYILRLGPGEPFLIRCLVLVTDLLKEETNACDL